MDSLLPITETTLQGVLERIVYTNQENGFTIGEFRVEEGVITLVGALIGVQCGETLRVQGQWVEHPRFGRQFKAERFESRLPATVHGIRRYLGSGLVPGIGKIYANKIVDYFGEDTLRVISEESMRLCEVPGIGKLRARAIKKSWDEHAAIRSIMVFLQTYGIATAQCLRIFKTYGDAAAVIIKKDPYRLARDIHGIGFKTADKIALNLGFPNDCNERLDAGILFALKEVEGNGHTCYPADDLASQASELLGIKQERLCERIATLEAQEHIFRLEDGRLQLPAAQAAETTIAEDICRLQEGESTLPSIDVERAIAWAQVQVGLELEAEQKQAIRSVLQNKLSIITGGPGTGKTTLLRALVQILGAKRASICLAAPTGRAAQRMKESTGIAAQTIHRLLKYDPVYSDFLFNRENPITTDFLVIDEASMLDIYLTSSLLQAIPDNAHVLFVGDIHQLPSIGPGNVLKDFIGSQCFAVTQLARIFRQDKQSEIVVAAHTILSGDPACPPTVSRCEAIKPEKDLHFIAAREPEACLEVIRELCFRWIPTWYNCDPVMDAQVLAPMYKGTVGILNLNNELQKTLNPAANQGGGDLFPAFRVGDKLIQTRNNYDKDVYNGDIGRINSIEKEPAAMRVDFDDETVIFERLEAADLMLAYAITIHKSQGSEFPIVIIPLLKQYFVMLQRNLLYTAITRGRRKVFLVGDPVAYALAVKNKESSTRHTTLQQRLLGAETK